MKTLHWILIALLILVLAVGGVYVYKTKKAVKSQQPNQKADPVKEQKKAQVSESVKNLQIRINALLPAEYPQLKVDGIYGQLTDKASNFVANLKSSGKLGATVETQNTDGSMITVNTDAVLSNVKDLAGFVLNNTPIKYTGLGLLANFF